MPKNCINLDLFLSYTATVMVMDLVKKAKE